MAAAFPKWHCKRLLRTDPLKALIVGGFVRGLSMRDVESLCEEAGLGKISKSTVARICAELHERFEAFCRRSLYGVNLVVLFLDAIYLPVRPSGPKEGVICVWGITENGSRELVSVRLGAREAKESVATFYGRAPGCSPPGTDRRRSPARRRLGRSVHVLAPPRAAREMYRSVRVATSAFRRHGQSRKRHSPGRALLLSDKTSHRTTARNTCAELKLCLGPRVAADLRFARGELGQRRAELPGRPYTLAVGDEILLAAQLRPHGQQRLENGTRAEVLWVDPATQRVLIRTDEAQPRNIEFTTREFHDCWAAVRPTANAPTSH